MHQAHYCPALHRFNPFDIWVYLREIGDSRKNIEQKMSEVVGAKINLNDPSPNFLVIRTYVDVISEYCAHTRTVAKAPMKWSHVLMLTELRGQDDGLYLCEPVCSAVEFYEFICRFCKKRDIPITASVEDVGTMYYSFD